MKIREVRAKTIDDSKTGFAGRFDGYKVIYDNGNSRIFQKLTPASKRFIESKTPKYVKCNVKYPHYVAIWTAQEKLIKKQGG